jgi:hypothetical protein
VAVRHYIVVKKKRKEKKRKRFSYPCNRPWRPIGLWDIKDPKFCKESAHRWRWGCQPYVLATLYPQEDSWYPLLLGCWRRSWPQGHSAAARIIRSIEKSSDLIENETFNLSACSLVPQTMALPRAPLLWCGTTINVYHQEQGVLNLPDLLVVCYNCWVTMLVLKKWTFGQLHCAHAVVQFMGCEG